MVFANRQLKLREINDALKTLEGSVFTILHKHLSIRMLCLKWLPRLLTVDQKQQRVEDSELSGQQRGKIVQSDQKRKCLVRIWPSYFGMKTEFHSSITLRKEKPSIANIIWRYWCV